MHPCLQSPLARAYLTGLAALALLLLAAPGPVLAQPVETVPPGFSSGPAREIVIGEAELLEGEIARPEAEAVLGKRRPLFRSLIRLRADFAPELRASVHQL